MTFQVNKYVKSLNICYLILIHIVESLLYYKKDSYGDYLLFAS